MNKNGTLKQTMTIFGAHLVFCFFVFITMVGIFGFISGLESIALIVDIVVLLIYAHILFDMSYCCAVKDLKPHTQTNPHPLKGIIFSLGAVIPVILSWAYYYVSWKIAPGTPTSIPSGTFAANMIYSFFTAPLWNFVSIKGGTANITGQIMSIALPVLACGIGYFFGYKKISFTKQINNIIFEKKKN